MPIKPVSVSQLNSYIHRILSTDPILNRIVVTGEVSNLTKHSSGHWYFALKDNSSKVNCFFPASYVSNLRFDISEGMEIIVYGNVSVYEKGGYYSVNVKNIEVQGEGSLKIAFDNLKRKLEEEGLFDKKHKKTIPENPKRIGVITSPTGAAIRDIISTVKRRNPTVDILLYPVLVQGDAAAASICKAIEEMNDNFSDLDLLIVGRGGGSLEDLWSFNEESVARAIFASKLPVISAVGHEIDYVISDYVADLRGATPTAAAELAVPHIDNFKDILSRLSPDKLYMYLEDNLNSKEYKLRMLSIALNSLNPNTVLNKGYAIVYKNGNVVSSGSSLASSDEIEIKFNDSCLKAVIKE